MRKVPLEYLEMIAEMPPAQKTNTYLKLYGSQDIDQMESLIYNGAFCDKDYETIRRVFKLNV